VGAQVSAVVCTARVVDSRRGGLGTIDEMFRGVVGTRCLERICAVGPAGGVDIGSIKVTEVQTIRYSYKQVKRGCPTLREAFESGSRRHYR
jgi:hypothetical protein